MSDEREDRWRRWQEWMGAAQQGDGPTYEKLLRELTPYLRGFVQRRLFDASATEDVVQNVLVSLHRARHTYRSERPLGPWLHAIARNAVIDHTRARARRGGREISLDAEGVVEPSVEPDPLPEVGLPPHLADALAALPDTQREAVELIHIHDLSVAEAAERAGVTRAALKVRAHRGYKALRARLEVADPQEAPT
jgi:RNA polymerase sigma-70 factor (ECF subfamily)